MSDLTSENAGITAVRVPRGWLILGSAIAAWIVVIAIGTLLGGVLSIIL